VFDCFILLFKMINRSLLLLVVCLLATSVLAKNVYISPFGSDPVGNGNETAPYRTLQKAISASLVNDVIVAKIGLYVGIKNIGLTLSGRGLVGQEGSVFSCTGLSTSQTGISITLNSNITNVELRNCYIAIAVTGSGNQYIQGVTFVNISYRPINVNSYGRLFIDGISFNGQLNPKSISAINLQYYSTSSTYNLNASISNCDFFGWEKAVNDYNYYGYREFVNCTFQHNNNGLYLTEYSTSITQRGVAVVNTTFYDNNYGIFSSISNLGLSRVTSFNSNRSAVRVQNGGIGVWRSIFVGGVGPESPLSIQNGNFFIRQSAFIFNDAAYGAAVNLSTAAGNIAESLFVLNNASVKGGAWSLLSSEFVAVRSVIANNTAPAGSALSCSSSFGRFVDSEVSGNVDGNCTDVPMSVADTSAVKALVPEWIDMLGAFATKKLISTFKLYE